MRNDCLNNILLVDDDEDDIDLFESALAEVSPLTKLFYAKSCKEGFGILNTAGFTAPDVIFMDLRMGQIDGFECVRLLKEREEYKHIPIVVLSTSMIPEDLDILTISVCIILLLNLPHSGSLRKL